MRTNFSLRSGYARSHPRTRCCHGECNGAGVEAGRKGTYHQRYIRGPGQVSVVGQFSMALRRCPDWTAHRVDRRALHTGRVSRVAERTASGDQASKNIMLEKNVKQAARSFQLDSVPKLHRIPSLAKKLGKYGEVRRVVSVEKHPFFVAGGKNGRYDVALVHLDAKSSKQPVDLAKVRPAFGTPVRATGFGLTDMNANLSTGKVTAKSNDALRTLTMTLNPLDQCNFVIGGIKPGLKTLCATHPKGTPCTGDSGTPLLWQPLPMVNKVIGVTSLGYR